MCRPGVELVEEGGCAFLDKGDCSLLRAAQSACGGLFDTDSLSSMFGHVLAAPEHDFI